MKRLLVVLLITICIFSTLFISLSNANPSNPVIGLNVTFKSLYNNQYLCADTDRTNPPEICANRSTAQWWEEFEVIDAGNGYIALKSMNNGQLLKFTSSSVPIKADGGVSINSYNSWIWVKNSNGTVSLQNLASGLWAQVDPAHGTNPAKLYADLATPNTYAQFYVGIFDVPYGCTVALKSLNNSKYMYMDNTYGMANMVAEGTLGTSIYENFLVDDAGNGYIALKSLYNNRYLSSTDTITPIRAIGGGAITNDEIFQWISNGDGTIALKHIYTGQYACADSDKNPGGYPYIYTDRSKVGGTWERFYCEIK
jgi:hypothetical protein